MPSPEITKKQPPLKPGSVLEVVAGNLDADGLCRSAAGSIELRVADAIPGEPVQIKITHRSRGGPVAWARRLSPAPGTEEHPQRRQAPCPHHERCGACGLQHIDDSAQLALKVHSALSQFPKALAEALVPEDRWLASRRPFAYRHKAVLLPALQGRPLHLGGFARGTHQVVGLPDCGVLAPSLSDAVLRIHRLLRKPLGRERKPILLPGPSADDAPPIKGGALRAILLRGNRVGDVLATFVVTQFGALGWLERILHRLVDGEGPVVGALAAEWGGGGDAVLPPTAPVRPVAGRTSLREDILGLRFQIGPTTFFQVHPWVLDSVAKTVAQLCLVENQPPKTLVDLFCGGGVLGLSAVAAMEPQPALIGVEIHREAVLRARRNAKDNGVAARFLEAGPAEALAKEPLNAPWSAIADPPRAGMKAKDLEALIAKRPDRLVYLSCHSPSLARDSRRLIDAGYRPTALIPADMLPQTPHIEWIACFQAPLNPE